MDEVLFWIDLKESPTLLKDTLALSHFVIGLQRGDNHFLVCIGQEWRSSITSIDELSGLCHQIEGL